MENKESSRPRRPLPIPGATRSSPAQRPNTPIDEPIPPSSFYSTSQPQHRNSPSATVEPGSTFTSFIPPEEHAKDYREPELVTAQDKDVDSAPRSTDLSDTGGGGWTTDEWNRDYDVSAWNNKGASSSWNDNFAGGNNYYSRSSIDVSINGRSEYEEKNWWDVGVRTSNKRPGAGVLPPVLLEDVHDSEHSLFSINIIGPPHQPQENTRTASPTPSVALHTSPPSLDEIRTSVPHPNAYFCPRDNGWVILSWKSSSIDPPLAASFDKSDHPPLPEHARRKEAVSCTSEVGGQLNKTHHFHKYFKAVDAFKLTPPLKVDEWEMESARTTHKKDATTEDMQSEEEGMLLDLYICCQCSFYFVASDLIPGIIPRRHMDIFVKDKRSNPPPGKTGEQAAVIALETIVLALENILWKGEVRALKVNSSSNTFRLKVGWNPNVQRIFQILGFSEEVTGTDLLLLPPNVQDTHSAGHVMRRKLLRAWIETGAFLEHFRKKYHYVLKDFKMRTSHVEIDSAREMYQRAVGAHPDQIPRNEFSYSLETALVPVKDAIEVLGLTLKTYSPELLAFAYLAQCRCDPADTIHHFTSLTNIVRAVEASGEPSPLLQDLLISESTRERFTTEELENAAAVLGFGMNYDLGVELDNDVEDEFVESAWKEAIKKSWKDPDNGADLQRKANEALRIIAEAQGRHKLRQVWQAKKLSLMSPDRAYKVLEVPENVDENMLITVFALRIQERPAQMDTMREALGVIADFRDSERLRQFLLTGQDPGEIKVEVRPDFPRGLNQLGNTCYLNSLLQYFYTIKELRETVMSTTKLDATLEGKLTDDELKKHRVGGRLVTRREIIRSKKFLGQLADLFSNLEYSKTAAVTPTIELAKLALVTSRDEEDDEIEKGGTDSSNDTDATLVDDGISRPSLTGQPREASPQSPSVLGKRARDEKKSTDMEVDSPICESPRDKEGFVLVSSPPKVPRESPKDPAAEPSTSRRQGENEDVEMQNLTPSQKPPPLPPRRKPETSSSDMMFGKQHDVAECMDNCMFQIETALLNFSGTGSMEGTSSDRASIVKRLFFGKIKQRLTGIVETRAFRVPVHDKTDLFSHLPVNVAEDGIDIYDGLSGYFDDVVEFQGRKARMEMSLVDVPPLLQIQLQRVQFNRDTLQPFKSQAYVKFWETIFLDRFMDDVEPQKKVKSKALQSELNVCRERLRSLSEGKNSPFAMSIEQSIGFLSGLENGSEIGVDDDLLFHLNQERTHVLDEIELLRQRAKTLKDELEELWNTSRKVEYELTSVFIHRGSSPSYGHYFFYSRHLPDAPDSWFKYNDSDVSLVSKEEVLADTTGSTANPYLLVFALKGSNVVDTVKRFRSDLEEN
ncbi:hypothetical protein AGABI1DRAFT_67056 [Agaricus bisporus var. burnettii JB137-S8]|uniref:ubiquitinyl hydrolase 1 n=1 Tax=Agaricus bisporus var. burnettii (strain JB137-S8 / ATCC MYA-4627 / FGSC 10392) TaxID=597362 RepID=K5X7R1_AGABU|nr:uncharacterized protein AGABI1DRAFT_67056 [Agaricus bisporus var. burnettii JB137-S8]EKM83956.1 hypothetical protein AGABI1DRAFT_67056 [Agaricus bisporus var. burnettii JB137-S8]